MLEFISEGRTYSQNVGNNGPAVIRSTSYTDFTATKRVELTDQAFTVNRFAIACHDRYAYPFGRQAAAAAWAAGIVSRHRLESRPPEANAAPKRSPPTMPKIASTGASTTK